MKKYDLHMHTCFSDGSMTCQELFESASHAGLSGLSITDHDTVEAYFNLPKTDLTIGIGAEFSCFLGDESVHILAYDFILDHPAITSLCQRHTLRRLNRNKSILDNLKLQGIHITEAELYDKFQDRSVGRPHIAQLLIDKGHCENIQQGFTRYLAEGQKGYAQGEVVSVEETLSIIHQARGKAFIAHPHIIKRKKLIKALSQLPFDGVEAYYARFTKEENEKWCDFAFTRKWLISGGSDFHGDFKVFNQLGSSWVDQEPFDQIFQHPLN